MHFRDRRSHPLPCAGTALFLAACITCSCNGTRSFSSLPTTTELSGPAALDVEWLGDLAFVQVAVENHAPRRFLLDTGASVLLLDPEFIRELGLDALPLDPDRGGLELQGAERGSKRVHETFWIDELRCGPLVARGLDALPLDLSELQQVMGGRFAGILPYGTFRDAVLVLDYPKRAVEVRPSKEPAREEANDRAWLPLEPSMLPHILLEVDGRPLHILLDSGSTDFISVPRSAGLPLVDEPVETGRLQSIVGTLPVESARLDLTINLGGNRLAMPVASLSRSEVGTIGGDLMRNFRVEIDQPNARVRFLATTDVKCHPLRATGFGVLRDGSTWRVAYVLDASPAQAVGIRTGDRIVAVEGDAVSAWPTDRYRDLVRNNDSVRLRLRRDGEPLSIECPIAVLVP